jgi:2-dehydro-3-deoxygalactonokinase
VILAVDSGTTSTRVWLVEDGNVRPGAATTAGARDVARTKDRGLIARRVTEATNDALRSSGTTWDTVEAVVAFGMITSEHGLEELPHLEAPVDRDALAAALVERELPEALPQPLFLVPGVRNRDEGGLESTDFMRGEETEVIGLLETGKVAPPFLYISTGSHTKFVFVDEHARIAWSVTTLSGEILWAVHRETLLADLVEPDGRVTDAVLAAEGASVAEAFGLSRAFFAARLLNRVRGESPSSCSAFIHGAVAGSDLTALRRTLERRGVGVERIAIGGDGALADAYRHLLGRDGWAATVQMIDEPLGAVGAWSLYSTARARRPLAEDRHGGER